MRKYYNYANALGAAWGEVGARPTGIFFENSLGAFYHFFLIVGGLCYIFLFMGAFCHFFLIVWVFFSMCGPCCYFFLCMGCFFLHVGGGPFWACLPPPPPALRKFLRAPIHVANVNIILLLRKFFFFCPDVNVFNFFLCYTVLSHLV